MGYEDWQLLRPQTPPWMRGKNTGALVQGLGKVKDQLLARLRAGILSRFPDETLAADDALAYKGAERLLPRGPGETSATYALRLRQAWETWMLAGSHGALLRQLEIAGFTGGYIVQDNGLWSRIPNPSTTAPTHYTARLATVTGLTTWTLGGGGATLTAPSNGTTSMDGSAVALNDLVFVVVGPTKESPGLYSCTQAGSGGTPTILTRASGWHVTTTVAARTAIDVTAGATLAGTRYELDFDAEAGVDVPHFDHGFISGGVFFGNTATIIARAQPGWTFDTRDDFWSRFLILFTDAVSRLATSDGQQAMRAIVERWRPAYAGYVGSVQITSGAVWGWPFDQTWGDGGAWGIDTIIFLGP